MWDDIGMSRGAKGLQNLVRTRGSHILAPQRAWLFFLAGLRCGNAHVFIGLDEHNHAIRRHMEAETVGLLQPILYFVPTDKAWADLPERLYDRFGTPTGFEPAPIAEMPMVDAPGGEAVIDRARLHALTRADDAAGPSGWEAPRDDLERQIADVWRDVLNVPQVGIHDNFLHLGGHSINAMQCAFRLTDLLKAEVGVRDIFEALTVAELARRIPTLPAAGKREQPPTRRAQGTI
jgi:hypothetical protein